jgi:Co/Zn/Cd efflux system component
MNKTMFSVPKMDCPSEEKLIRMALSDLKDVELLQFDLSGRKLTAFHEGNPKKVLSKLEPLNFGAQISSTQELSEIEENLLHSEKAKASGSEKDELKVLRILLGINAVMFVIEIIWGLMAQSTGLIADGMDMFADAAVYGISLYAVGKAVSMQRKAARFSGYAQLALAGFAVAEVFRRFIFGSEPEPGYMVVVSILALIANVVCLVLISKHRSGGVHMKASAIFSANDVIANCGVILAGLLVGWTGSRIPDLMIGLLIAVVVFRGALSILKISSETKS